MAVTLEQLKSLDKYGWNYDEDDNSICYCYFYDISIDADKYFEFKSRGWVDLKSTQVERIKKILQDDQKVNYSYEFDYNNNYIYYSFNPDNETEMNLTFGICYTNDTIVINFTMKKEEELYNKALKYYNMIFD